MVLQNYQNFIEMISNMIYIVAFGGGLKCLRKIHLNTQFIHKETCQKLRVQCNNITKKVLVITSIQGNNLTKKLSTYSMQ